MDEPFDILEEFRKIELYYKNSFRPKMFFTKKEEDLKNVEDVIREYNLGLKELKSAHAQEISDLKKKYELDLKDKAHELKVFESAKVKEMQDKVVSLEKEVATLKKENEMMVKITDLNADIVDVKDLVKNLINKLPEIKINGLTVSNNGDSK